MTFGTIEEPQKPPADDIDETIRAYEREFGRRIRLGRPLGWRRMGVRAVAGVLIFLVVGNALILVSSLFFQVTAADAQLRASGIDNVRRVDDRVIRGAAPTEAGLRDLAALGVTDVVDLRAEDDLDDLGPVLDELGMTRHHLPIRDGQLPTEAQARRFMDIVEQARGQVFLHCGAGVGRTGAMTAFYLNATGQADGTAALAQNLAVGPPSLEQIVFSVTTEGGAYAPSSLAVTAMSRALDAPRRIWHNLT